MPTAAAQEVEPNEDQVGVRVWFGEHVVSTHVADLDRAERYVDKMTQWFPGLRVTTEDLPPGAEARHPQLPVEHLWPLTAK